IRIPSNLDVSIDSQILENSQQLLEKHTILSGEGRTYNGSTVRWELAATSKRVSTLWLEALRRAKLELHDLETPDHLSFITGLVVRMKDSIEVCDRFHYLKPYKRCFMGDEAIAWIMRVRDCSLNEALTIGASMINLGLIYHVKREHFLCNKPFFYRFNPSLAQLAESLEGDGVFIPRCSCSTTQDDTDDASGERSTFMSSKRSSVVRDRNISGASSSTASTSDEPPPPPAALRASPDTSSKSESSVKDNSTVVSL
ncbi:IML1, partial [Symbiodinium microadriaticum]